MVTGQGLVDNLLEADASLSSPTFHYNEMVETLEVIGSAGGAAVPRHAPMRRRDCLRRKAIVVAAGGGSFQPKRPPVAGHRGIRERRPSIYAVRKMDTFRRQDAC